MQLLIQKPGEQKCLIYCAAMLLGISVETVQTYLGTDGQEEWWPTFSYPKSLRGTHIQEIQDIFLAYGHCLYPIEKYPYLGPNEDPRFAKSIMDAGTSEQRFKTLVKGNSGILLYQTHAKALDTDGKIYDPNGKIQQITSAELSFVKEAWLIAEIKS